MLVGEELDVSLVLGEGVPVEELEGVLEVDEERVDVAALVVLALTDDDDVGDGEALRRLAMLRPRKVMDDTAASASPASHRVDSYMPLEKALLGISCVMLTSRKQLAGPPLT